MKGTILYCLEETIIEKYGSEKWDECVIACGYKTGHSFVRMIRDDIDETESLNVFLKSAETLKMELNELFDIFGEYWCCTYAPSLYGAFYVGIMSSKKGITKLDWVHDRVTKNIPNARPPRFDFNWITENKLELKYKSERALIDLFISLIKGLNKQFNDSCIIRKVSETDLIIEFLDEPGKTEVIYEC
ncbi:MAG: heme NO-binding domain-containing protein [Cyclobacteriaceae bacterium]|nr:heme NO-binding domain-containing protein [Cyclobacteriaceae bacterium]